MEGGEREGEGRKGGERERNEDKRVKVSTTHTRNCEEEKGGERRSNGLRSKLG